MTFKKTVQFVHDMKSEDLNFHGNVKHFLYEIPKHYDFYGNGILPVYRRFWQITLVSVGAVFVVQCYMSRWKHGVVMTLS